MTPLSHESRQRSRSIAVVASFAAALLWGSQALAGGFLLPEQSGEGLGRASAVAASTLEPAAVWYNPAALSSMEGVQLSVYGGGYFGQTEFTPRDGGDATDSEPVKELVGSLFATARVSDRVGLGFGVYAPFGLGVTWPDAWEGREQSIDSSIVTINFNPVVSVRVLDALSVAAGVDVMRTAVDFSNGLPPAVGGDVGSVRIGGATWGLGFNAALLYRPLPDKVQLALTYRSRAKMEFEGRAHFAGIQEPIFTESLFDQDGTAEITLPDVFQAGVAVHPFRDLLLEVDGTYVMWSTYDTIPIDFSQPQTSDTAFYPNYRDIFSLRISGEYTTPLKPLRVRGGFVYEENPAPEDGISPSLPDAATIGIAAGAGYRARSWSADFGYMLVLMQPSDARNPSDPSIPPQSPEGTYRTTAHILGLTLSGRFGDTKE
jgi:long-chain fatty acid transport protein